MPFKNYKQMQAMFARSPAVAKRWEDRYGSIDSEGHRHPDRKTMIKQKPGQKAAAQPPKPFQHKRKKKGKGRKGLLAREKALEAARGGPSGGPKSAQEAALEKKLGVRE